MLRVFVDTGSSIKFEEKEKYNVEILPLKILMADEEYLDGVTLSIEEFYNKLFATKKIPKTSLPGLEDVKAQVEKFTNACDNVLILTISGEISGSFNAIKLLFEDNKKVRVFDSRLAVGGIRILVEEINRNRDKSLDEIEEKLKNLIPRVKILAIPETLEYLMRGGRLSKTEWLLGTVLKIKPIITFRDGKVCVDAKKTGLKHSMKYIVSELDRLGVDENYPIIASYTYKDQNLKSLIEMTDKKYLPLMSQFDNLDPAIAAHWGPNAFGYIFVTKN
jgi:DegV family protein with EDD domain